MPKEIIINSSSTQTRVAIIEDGNLVDFFVENEENRRTVGDIYLGKVARVLPGIKAAFIDIGLKHDAFLHFSDIGERTKELQGILGDDSDVDEDEDDESSDKQTGGNGKQEFRIPKLQKGKEIIVQIAKEPVENKGVRVTSAVSLAGRFCVLLPFDNKIGISKKIMDYRERRRLRTVAREIIPKKFGLIVRTVAKNQSEEGIKEDLKNLLNTWEEIAASVKTEEAPSLIYQDLNTTSSVIRDLFTNDVNRIFIDSKKLFKQIKNYVNLVQPSIASKIEFFKHESIFEAFKVEEQIKSIFGRKVPLPSGGHIVIEHTEAMVVIDINSGRYAKNKEQELNSLKTDLEAAREIARQLRLRDIGGIVVCDFIDLEDEKNRKKIYDELKKEFRRDRAKVSILPMSDFGLIQITRQRIRQNIQQSVNEPCPYCLGTGTLIKKSNLEHEIKEWIKRFKRNSSERSITLKVHPTLGVKLKEGRINTIAKLQFKHFLRIKLVEDKNLHLTSYRFYSNKTDSDITDKF